MSKEKLIIVLRWIAVLPCAWLASLSAYLLIFLCNGLQLSEESLIAIYILPLVCAYISGFTFMAVGILLAPSHIRIIALILTLVLLIILRTGVPPVFTSKENLQFIKFFFTVVGSTIAYVSLREVVED